MWDTLNPSSVPNALEWGVRRKDVCAVPVEEKASFRQPLTLDRLKEIRYRLSDVRLNLKVIQRFGDTELWGLALLEYCGLLTELEPYTQDKARFFNE